jgi:uncharacterized coiled-coil protein SlyX
MTELERMLKDILTHMEQEMSATLMAQGKTLEEQRQVLASQREELAWQRGQIQRLNSDLRALTQRLQDVSDVYKNLEPLLPLLQSILNGNRR